MGRTTLKNNTHKFVTHLLQNEKWLNDQIGEAQEVAAFCKQTGDVKAYSVAIEKAADLINQHRLFVAELLPYCLPKLSAVMGSDSEQAMELMKQLMDLGGEKKEPTDSATAVDAPDGDE
jgi:hypothetical protein